MLLESLAQRISETTFDRLPAAVVATAKQAILDTLGVTLAGSAEARILQPAATAGPALIFGETRRVDVLSAAFINGVAAHALDFDDRHSGVGGPLSAPILPALWTAAPGVHGRAFVAAYAVGIDCATSLGRSANARHNEVRPFPLATLAACDSAAACARLLQLTPEQTAAALALAASGGSGIETDPGTATPFQVGQAARDGLRAALLAQAGAVADRDALERGRAVFSAGEGRGLPDASWALASDGDTDPDIAFRLHPCCQGTHAALDALLHLRTAHDLTPKYVRRIECWLHPVRLGDINRPDPASGAEAKSSLPYVLARALKQGLVRLADFSDEAARDPAIRGTMRKIHLAPNPQAGRDDDDFRACLRVTTVRGEVFEHTVNAPLGRDRNHPPPPGALEAKFRDCAETVLDPESAEALIGYCTELDRIPDAGDVLDVIAAGAISAQESAPWTTSRRAAG